MARMSELRVLTGSAPAPAPASTTTPANAAAFQQQLLTAGLTDPSAAAPGAASMGGVPILGVEDLYGAMQGGGLSTQAAMLGQLGAPGAPVTHVTGKTTGLDDQLLKSLDAVGRELGRKLDVISGNRTYQEQAALYQKYLNGTGNLAAPPGKSNHEHGDAADVYVNGVALADVPGAREIAARHGLHFPVGGESWHVERTDAH